MNTRMVLKYLGIISIMSSSMFIPALFCDVLMGEYIMIITFSVSLLSESGIGLLLWVLFRKSGNKLLHRDSLALAAFTWIMMVGYCALPFIFSGELGVVDAYFESMNGLTTTGSSILADIEALPKSLLFW